MLLTPDFHDDYLYGVNLCRKGYLELNIITKDDKCFKIEIPNIKELLVNNFREGNIIFGINIYAGIQCQEKSEIIKKLYCINENTSHMLINVMKNIIDKRLFLFYLDSSYGCDIAATFSAAPSDIKIHSLD